MRSVTELHRPDHVVLDHLFPQVAAVRGEKDPAEVHLFAGLGVDRHRAASASPGEKDLGVLGMHIETSDVENVQPVFPSQFGPGITSISAADHANT